MKQLNATFKALTDPTRRKIIELLKERDLTAGEIAGHFQMSKPSISHHLNLLKQAEIIADEKKGQFIYYSLNTTVFQDVMYWLAGLMEKDDDENEFHGEGGDNNELEKE